MTGQEHPAFTASLEPGFGFIVFKIVILVLVVGGVTCTGVIVASYNASGLM